MAECIWLSRINIGVCVCSVFVCVCAGVTCVHTRLQFMFYVIFYICIMDFCLV